MNLERIFYILYIVETKGNKTEKKDFLWRRGEFGRVIMVAFPSEAGIALPKPLLKPIWPGRELLSKIQILQI